MTVKFIIVTVLCSLLFLSCKEKEKSILEPTPQEPAIFIEGEYSNFAWGKVLGGSVIDNSGNVYTYDVIKAGKTWKSNESGYYTESELLNKFHSCDTLIKIISRDSLEIARHLAMQTTDNSYSSRICPGRDMGSAVISLYIFRSDSNKYKQIVLDVSGDCSYHNQDPHAIELVEWFRSH